MTRGPSGVPRVQLERTDRTSPPPKLTKSKIRALKTRDMRDHVSELEEELRALHAARQPLRPDQQPSRKLQLEHNSLAYHHTLAGDLS